MPASASRIKRTPKINIQVTPPLEAFCPSLLTAAEEDAAETASLESEAVPPSSSDQSVLLCSSGSVLPRALARLLIRPCCVSGLVTWLGVLTWISGSRLGVEGGASVEVEELLVPPELLFSELSLLLADALEFIVLSFVLALPVLLVMLLPDWLGAGSLGSGSGSTGTPVATLPVPGSS